MPPAPIAAEPARDTDNRRSRLTPERERELYEAVLRLVLDDGYDNLTMDTIAAKTRSSKATLYRQWGSKPVLVAAAIHHLKATTTADIDTGSLRDDLREIARRFAGDEFGPMRLLCPLAEMTRRYPEFREAFDDRIGQPGRDAMSIAIDRSIDRGEIDPSRAGLDFIQHMLAGAVLARPMAERCDADLDYIYRFIDAVVLPALGVPVPVEN